jgi:hypothetical protein
LRETAIQIRSLLIGSAAEKTLLFGPALRPAHPVQGLTLPMIHHQYYIYVT